MSLTPLDLAILAVYFAATIFIGFWISHRASRSMRDYFLGGNALPWYALGLSNASGMFDISGTMVMVSWLFVYGLKSVWIPWLWPVFNQVFLMIYLSTWMRRSGVMTGAEWIRFRFGDSRGAQLAHMIVVLFAIVNVIGFLAYGFIGIGKFTAAFLPWSLSADPQVNANIYGLIITAITTIYVVKGGMFSVVFTEVMQFVVMTIGCVWVGIIAMQRVSPEMLGAALPAGWRGLWPDWRLNIHWADVMPAVEEKIVHQDGWQLFGALFSLLLIKGYLQSMAGPAPNYDMQRVLSTRSPRDAALMSFVVNIVLLIPRYMMITGLTVLAIVFLKENLRGVSDQDFELILPLTMRSFIPAGLAGLLIAALLAAFMSTYAATVNAAPAYIVNDIYKRYVNPNASERAYVWMSYATSIAVVVLGTAFGFMTEQLNDVVKWLTIALYGGYTAANFLKWYWWRFNSYGYFWGMVAGMIAAGVMPTFLNWLSPDSPTIWAELPKEVVSFPIILAISMAGCIVVTLLTPPDDLTVLKQFYLQVRPWGFWRPIRELVQAENPHAEPNRSFGRDMINVVIGIVWQTALTTTGIYLVLEDYGNMLWSLGVVAVTSIWLKFNWYDKLEDYPSGFTVQPAATDSQMATA